MWSLLTRKAQLMIVVGCTIMLVWSFEAIWQWLSGEVATPWKWLSLIVTLIGGVFASIANVAWFGIARRLPILQKWTFPDLNGRWTGEMKSTYEDPATGRIIAPFPVTFDIRQTLFSTTVSVSTDKATSRSVRAFLEPDYDAHRFRVWYSYTHEPRGLFRMQNPAHQGVAWLDLDFDQDPDVLEGRYFTARHTSGDIQLRRESADGNH